MLPVLALLVGNAFAGDDDLQKMLNSIPEIKGQSAAPAVEKPKPEDEADLDLPTYTARVRTAIFASWKPDAKLAAKKPTLAVKLLVKVNDDGTLSEPIAIQLSGNKKFDEAAIDAVYATASVAAPPSWLRVSVHDGISVEFTAAAATAK